MNRLIKEINSILCADKIILGYPELKAKNNAVNLNLYHPEFYVGHGEDKNINNLGDYLSKVIVEFMCKSRGVSIDKYIRGRQHLYAIGSILLMGYQNCTVWGTGLPFVPSALRGIMHRKPLRKLDIRCVRGPLTADILNAWGHNCPKIYGDPAVLMPIIYTPTAKENKKELLYIPHYQHEDQVEKLGINTNVVSMRTSDYKTVIDEICSAKRVISSSLHGIILAESYGIPAVFLNTWQKRYLFKFEDWYLSTGRTPDYSVTTFDEAIKAEVNIPKNIQLLQNNLIHSFPEDLWR